MRVRALGVALLLVVTVACAGPRPASEGSPQPSASAPAAAVSPTPRPTPTPPLSAAPQSAQCGQRITSDFVLANDLKCNGDAFIITADNVTLDLGGKTITGPGMGPQTWPQPQLDSVGVRTGGHAGVTIRNGTISEFSTGIYFVDMERSRIEDVTSQRSRYGFYIHASNGNTILRSTVVGNIYGLHLQDANDNVVQANNLIRQTYNSPGGYGIYLYRSRNNRIIENTIENNVNWGIWFSDARNNSIFRNNVSGNSPQVSDNNPDANLWYDAEKKEGNWWSDYRGTDGDRDHVGDTPYAIQGPGGAVDAYPFVERDGWKKKTGATIDHYRPPLARPAREVRLVVVAGGTVGLGRPHDSALVASSVQASSVAIQTDGRTLLALDGRTLTTWDLTNGDPSTRTVAIDGGIVGANRDGVSALIVGPRGAQQIDLVTGRQEFYAYSHAPQELAPSYKHNHIFVATPGGIDLLYLNLGGRTPYTIPLDGPAGAMSMNLSGTRIYTAIRGKNVINVVDTEQYAVVQRIAIPAEANAIAVSPREEALYVGTADGVLAIDLGNEAVRARASFVGAVADLAISPNADELYVALAGQQRAIAVLDTATLRTANVIPLVADPTRVIAASY
ncbi:MAG TPA: NosD domain-containing protein [Candidatus Limnocylindria bacterium]|nr:NosD domain-containing protein [Candidatus Limnocylindria bacterium]